MMKKVDCYHLSIPAGGNRPIFLNEAHYHAFLLGYRQIVAPYAETYAYCLLPDHFHILLRFTVERDSAEFLLKLHFSHYAQMSGVVLPSDLIYQPVERISEKKQLLRYIHYNPAHHQLIDRFGDWKWSSYKALVSQQPTLLAREIVLSWFYGLDWLIDAHFEPCNELLIGRFLLDD